MWKRLLDLLTGLFVVKPQEPFEENGQMYIFTLVLKDEDELYIDWMSNLGAPVGQAGTPIQTISLYKWQKTHLGPAVSKG